MSADQLQRLPDVNYVCHQIHGQRGHREQVCSDLVASAAIRRPEAECKGSEMDYPERARVVATVSDCLYLKLKTRFSLTLGLDVAAQALESAQLDQAYGNVSSAEVEQACAEPQRGRSWQSIRVSGTYSVKEWESVSRPP